MIVNLRQIILILKRNLNYKIFQAEIEGRHKVLAGVREQGNALLKKLEATNAPESADVVKMIKELDKSRLVLNGAWDKRSKLLTECHNLQVS